MRKYSILLYRLLTILFILYTDLSWSNEALPTHCKSDEFTYLTTKMHKEGDRNIQSDAEKYLSLCSDKEEEPFGKFVYRYGKIGKVEMEQVATNTNKFGLSTQSDSGSNTGLISISFSKGEYIYEVSEGIGMATRVHLLVYRAGKPILNLVSDYDYESNLIKINYTKASSSIFKIIKPIDPW